MDGELATNAISVIKLKIPKSCENLDKLCQLLCFLKSLPQVIIAIARLRNAKRAAKLCILFTVEGTSPGRLVGKIESKNKDIHQTAKKIKLKIDIFIFAFNPKNKSNCPVESERKAIV